MVHRPDRFLDILHAMENANIAPKKLGLFIRSRKEANVLLIEGSKAKTVFVCYHLFYIQ